MCGKKAPRAKVFSSSDAYGMEIFYARLVESKKTKNCLNKNTMENKESTLTLILGDKLPFFHVVMDRNKFGLSEEEAQMQDMADEYAIVYDKDAIGGIVIYAKCRGEWVANPFSTRFLVRVLLENAGISLPSLRND